MEPRVKLHEILPLMTKLYLNRTVSSFIKDVRINDEQEMRDIILRNEAEFYNEERVERNLDFLEDERNVDVLNEIILITLVQRDNYLATYDELIEDVLAFEKQVLNDAQDAGFLKLYVPDTARDVYLPVLKAAWEKDESLNSHEKNILEVLRKRLRLSRRHHRLIETQIGRFPQSGNNLHTSRHIEESLRDLQMKGIVLRFKTDEEYFVIPSEIAHVVRYQVGGELKAEGYRLLLERLRVNQLKQILSEWGVPTGGAKSELVENIVRYEILPSLALDILTSAELTEVLRGVEGVRISGTKEEKIGTLIDHFESVVTLVSSDVMDERALYFDHYHALATRDYKVLRGNDVIGKDVDVERYFEEATKYLFEVKFNMELRHLDGSKRADGSIQYNAKEVFLWDNKSTEQPYRFPAEHYDQFLGYIESDRIRPTAFLVIVGEVHDDAALHAHKLKAHSRTDTDVAIIRAEDLKFVAETWKEHSDKKEPVFNLQVFNMTGILDRKTLINRMSWAL